MSSRFLIFALVFAASIAEARFTMSPSWVDLGSVELGDILGRSQNVWIQNNDSEQINLTFSNMCYNDFEVRTYTCSSLQPNQSCWIEVVFKPRSSEGYKSCSVYVYDNTGSSQTLQVSGTARKPYQPGPLLAPGPAPLPAADEDSSNE